MDSRNDIEGGDYNHKLSRKEKILIVVAVLGILAMAAIVIPIVLRARNADDLSPPNTTGEFNGEGYAVAILDSGVNKSHVALENKVVEEICVGYKSPIVDGYGEQLTNLCPEDAKLVETKGNIGIYRGTGVASDCTSRITTTAETIFEDICMHGTALAGVATMDKQMIHTAVGDVAVGGSAPGAKIIAVQVYAYTPQSGRSPAHLSLDDSLTLVAMEYIAENHDSFGIPVASVNYSVGTEEYSSGTWEGCRANAEAYPVTKGIYDKYMQMFARLKGLGIAPIMTTGNSGEPGAPGAKINAIGFPGCVEGAIAVGAVDDTEEHLASYSQNATITSLLAPGGDGSQDTLKSIWFPAGNSETEFRGWGGTSVAAPYVVGAFAAMRQKNPRATVDQILEVLKNTGTLINDTRSGYMVGPKPLVQLEAALLRDM